MSSISIASDKITQVKQQGVAPQHGGLEPLFRFLVKEKV
jgi:hypothetical protein